MLDIIPFSNGIYSSAALARAFERSLPTSRGSLFDEKVAVAPTVTVCQTFLGLDLNLTNRVEFAKKNIQLLDVGGSAA